MFDEIWNCSLGYFLLSWAVLDLIIFHYFFNFRTTRKLWDEFNYNVQRRISTTLSIDSLCFIEFGILLLRNLNRFELTFFYTIAFSVRIGIPALYRAWKRACVRARTRMHARIHMHTRIHTCSAFTHACTQMRLHTLVHARSIVLTLVHTPTHSHPRKLSLIHTCIPSHSHPSTLAHTHTHIHLDSHPLTFVSTETFAHSNSHPPKLLLSHSHNRTL